MDQIDLSELRRLAEAASPLPWEEEDGDIANETRVLFETKFATPEDAQYLVAAANAVPGLCDRLDAALSALRELKVCVEKYLNGIRTLPDEHEAAALAAAREVLERSER